MGAPAILVAFASSNGSTAGIAEVIAAELRDAGWTVECHPVSEVDSLEPYAALVLGSGIFVRSRKSDGGGFLARHAPAISIRPVWLFCAGPIGRGRTLDTDAPPECTVMDVARAIGARGAAAFGAAPAASEVDVDAIGRPVEMPRVRAWAHEIARELDRVPLAAAS